MKDGIVPKIGEVYRFTSKDYWPLEIECISIRDVNEGFMGRILSVQEDFYNSHIGGVELFRSTEYKALELSRDYVKKKMVKEEVAEWLG